MVSAGQVAADLLDERRERAWKISAVQPNRSSSSRFSAASLRGLIGHQTAPARLMPKTQVNAVGSFADRIGDRVAGPRRPGGQGRRDAEAQLPHLGVRPGLPVGGEARRVRAERRALVEVVDQSHWPQPSTVTTGSRTSPKLLSTPSSSRCPKAWQPEAKPARRGGCWSREYAA